MQLRQEIVCAICRQCMNGVHNLPVIYKYFAQFEDSAEKLFAQFEDRPRFFVNYFFHYIKLKVRLF